MAIVDCCCSSSSESSSEEITQARAANEGSETYEDANTQSTPISVPVDTPTDLTNDGLGSGTTIVYAPTSTTQIFNTTTNSFDFSSLTLGSLVDIQLDVDVITTLPNQLVDIDLILDVGGAFHSIKFAREILTEVGVNNITRYRGFSINSLGRKNNPAKFTILSPVLASVRVNSIFCKILKR